MINIKTPSILLRSKLVPSKKYNLLLSNLKSYRYLMIVLIVFLVACKSTQERASEDIEGPLQQEQAKPNIQYEEEMLPEYFYWDTAKQYLFIKNRSIIEQFAKNLGINNLLIGALVEQVFISISDDDFLLMAKVSSSTTFYQKVSVMKSIGAVPSDDMRYWNYDDTEQFYFDIGYENAIVLSNRSLKEVGDEIGWQPPEIVEEISQNQNADMWGVGDPTSFLQVFEMSELAAQWAGIIVRNYSKDKDIKSSFVFDYYGNKSTSATIKLLMPVLLKSLGVDTLSSLPNIAYYGDIMIIEGVLLPQRTFWSYFTVQE